MTSIEIPAATEQRPQGACKVAAIPRGFPAPGFARPTIAVPTVLVWLGSFVAWSGATVAVLCGVSHWWLVFTIVVQSLVTVSIFIVAHESIHYTVGRPNWINQVFGRLSMPFVSLFATFPLLAYIHLAHHRNTNETIHDDPDAWSIAGPRWQLPLRWLTIDAWYCRFYLARLRRRPRKEALGFAVHLTVALAFVTAILILGYGRELVLIYFIPQRIGVGVLAWWFDWLPHHDLGTAKTNRFRATRVRVGWERVLCPLLMYQNYHLVHHIHPGIPFYLYVKAWKAAEADYLNRNVPITTAWGREMTPSEYRTWREVTSPRRGCESQSSHGSVAARQWKGLSQALFDDVARQGWSARDIGNLLVRVLAGGFIFTGPIHPVDGFFTRSVRNLPSRTAFGGRRAPASPASGAMPRR